VPSFRSAEGYSESKTNLSSVDNWTLFCLNLVRVRQLFLLSYSTGRSLYDAEHDLLVIAKFLVLLIIIFFIVLCLRTCYDTVVG